MANHYHPEEIEDFGKLPPRKQWIIREGQRRPLTTAEVATLKHQQDWTDYSAWYARNCYTTMVSWSLITEGFVNDLWYLMARNGVKKLVEPYAGKGTLRRIVKKPFMTWKSYDAHPVTDDVERGCARRVMADLRPGDAEVIIVSWVPYQGNEDVSLLKASRRLQIPIYWIGESRWGCTGSESFWKTLSKQGFKVDYHEHGVEMENWYGIHDQFMLITPPPPRAPHRERKVHNLRPRRAKVRRA